MYKIFVRNMIVLFVHTIIWYLIIHMLLYINWWFVSTSLSHKGSDMWFKSHLTCLLYVHFLNNCNINICHWSYGIQHTCTWSYPCTLTTLKTWNTGFACDKVGPKGSRPQISYETILQAYMYIGRWDNIGLREFILQ